MHPATFAVHADRSRVGTFCVPAALCMRVCSKGTLALVISARARPHMPCRRQRQHMNRKHMCFECSECWQGPPTRLPVVCCRRTSFPGAVDALTRNVYLGPHFRGAKRYPHVFSRLGFRGCRPVITAVTARRALELTQVAPVRCPGVDLARPAHLYYVHSIDTSALLLLADGQCGR